MTTRLISMSLYGDSPKYLNGAIANARLLDDIYPGWKLRVYCERGLDCSALTELGCEVVTMPRSRKHSGMFWRFLPAWETELERVIFRDADSRINVREAAAVQAWIESGKTAHCLHDHPHHVCMPIMGGMWGIKTGFLPEELRLKVVKYSRRSQPRVADMKFLRDHVHPLIQYQVLRHTFRFLKKWGGVPFPKHPEFDGFVGQIVEEETCSGAEEPSREVQPTSQKSSAPHTT